MPRRAISSVITMPPKFQQKLELMNAAAALLNQRLGEERVTVEIKQQYRNMAEIVRDYPELIDVAKEAYLACGVEPQVLPIRGGTDGAQLSFRGLPCPNLSTGGYCYHGVNEFVPVSSLVKMTTSSRNSSPASHKPGCTIPKDESPRPLQRTGRFLIQGE